MFLGYTFASGRGDTDLLLGRFADRICREGYRPVGTVQTNEMCKETGVCDMDVRVLPDGPVIRISQSLGPGSRGCRLNPSALEDAVGKVSKSLGPGVDCLIVNKFGKHETDGRGFRPVIGEAMSMNIPVIVGLGQRNQPAFLDFADGVAEEIEPNVDAIRSWMLRSLESVRERQE